MYKRSLIYGPRPFLSNNQNFSFLIFNCFSSRPGGKLFQQITNFKPGDESPKVFLRENDFITHQNAFKNALENITQTPEEQSQFVYTLVEVVHTKGVLTSQNIISAVKTSLDGDVKAQEAVTALSREVIPLANRFPLDPQAGVDLKETIEVLRQPLLIELNEKAEAFRDVPLDEHPQFAEMVTRFISKINLGSGRILDSLDVLISSAGVNELITFLSSSPMLAKGLGLHLFMLGYYSFSLDGSLTSFLQAVRNKVDWKVQPVYRSIKVSWNFIYKNKVTLIGTTSLMGFAYNYWFNNAPSTGLSFRKAVILPQLTEVPALVHNSSSVFMTPGTETKFIVVKNWLCQSAYMASNVLSNLIWAGQQGVLDSSLTPELKEQMEKSVTRLIPSVIDNIGKK